MALARRRDAMTRTASKRGIPELSIKSAMLVMPSMRDMRKAARWSRPCSEMFSVGMARIGQAWGLPMKARKARSNKARDGSIRSSTPGGGARSASCRASSAAKEAGPARLSLSAARHSPNSSFALARTSAASTDRSSRVSESTLSLGGKTETSLLGGAFGSPRRLQSVSGVSRSWTAPWAVGALAVGPSCKGPIGTATLSDLRSVSAAKNWGMGDSTVSRRDGDVCSPASSSVTRWRNFGHDRLYIRSLAGADLGWWDLTTDEGHALDPQLARELELIVRDWQASLGVGLISLGVATYIFVKRHGENATERAPATSVSFIPRSSGAGGVLQLSTSY